jgi:hypothetical protein
MRGHPYFAVAPGDLLLPLTDEKQACEVAGDLRVTQNRWELGTPDSQPRVFRQGPAGVSYGISPCQQWRGTGPLPHCRLNTKRCKLTELVKIHHEPFHKNSGRGDVCFTGFGRTGILLRMCSWFLYLRITPQYLSHPSFVSWKSKWHVLVITDPPTPTPSVPGMQMFNFVFWFLRQGLAI